MKVSEVMKAKFLYLDGEDKFYQAAGKLLSKDRREIPVLSEGRFIGMFTVSDVAAAFAGRKIARDSPREAIAKLRNEPVRKIMRTSLLGYPKLDPDWDISRAFAILAGRNFECIPVLERKGRLVGVVFVAELRKELVDMLNLGFDFTPKKAKDDRFAGESDTTVDEVLKFVQHRGSVSAEEVAGQFKIPVATVEEYALSLEKHGLLKIEYGIIGKMKIKRVERK